MLARYNSHHSLLIYNNLNKSDASHITFTHHIHDTQTRTRIKNAAPTTRLRSQYCWSNC